MASLKRLLNPSEHSENYYPNHRPYSGWEEAGELPDCTPILPDQTWQQYHDEVLSTDSLQDDSSLTLADDSESLPPNFVHGQIEDWAERNDLEDDPQICYGMIYHTPVKLRGDMSELDRKLSSGGDCPIKGHHQMSIVKAEGQYLVLLADSHPMGELNVQLEKALEVIDQQGIDLDVFAPTQSIRETIGRATKGKDAVVRVHINVYGPRSKSGPIGREMSEHKVFLQRPDHMRDGVKYENPHVLRLSGFSLQQHQGIINSEVGNKLDVDRAEALKKTMEEVHSSLTRGQKLVGLEGDQRLKTRLLDHQKQALQFMEQRESGPIPEEYCLWKPCEIEGRPGFRHVITNTTSPISYPETGGGILADEMGMGKTLSILALILRTLKDAHKWSSGAGKSYGESLTSPKGQHRTRATLIVASSDLMINEWIQEMDRHFDKNVSGLLKYIKYHGANREDEISKLCDSDLIITTYHTLASDNSRKRRALSEIEWYRLVLDEAHIIRRQSTVLNQAVSRLRARSRWCLTGTPIQNRLDDIGSLFAFLKVNQFHSIANFRRYIVQPIEDRSDKRRKLAKERFAQLLDSLYLRRTRELLRLPNQRDRVRKICLSHEERAQYNQVKSMMTRAIQNQVGSFDHKNTLGMFQLQLQLRIMCNHGTFQQPFNWNRRHLKDTREAMELDWGTTGEVSCSNCRANMPLHGSAQFKRYNSFCKHVLCYECMEDTQSFSQDDTSACPMCSTLRQANSSFKYLQNSFQQKRSQVSGDDNNYFRQNGNSSKMNRLMCDVQEHIYETKSIIFTCWTHTLDLIERHLNGMRIMYSRIDGEVPTSKRERILGDFARNPSLRILIMTTGTGAVGLNLATANRVFLVEPQWNPSVERQAIARATRIGQQQAVQVTRYVVQDTVEEDMQTLQDKKISIAELAHKNVGIVPMPIDSDSFSSPPSSYE